MESPEVKLNPGDTDTCLTIDGLPLEIFLKIIGYLNRDELIAAQSVCHYWRTAAHDISLWKNYTYIITGTQEDKEKIKVMPALRNIDGRAENSFVNVILDHVRNLNKMNCKFNPPISYVQVQSLVQRYPELQSVTLDVCIHDTVQSVEILQTCENLEEIIFHKQISCGNRYCSCSSLPKLISVMNIFADPKNFTTLNNLDLSTLLYSRFLKRPLFSDVFIRVLTNKSHQLQSLKFCIDSNVDVGIINAVNMCSRIHNLHLVVLEKCPVSIDVSRMTQLRSLSAQLCVNDDDFMKSLSYYLSRNSCFYLTEVNLSVNLPCQYGAGILESLTKNARQLRILRYWDLGNYVDDFQLEHVLNLSKLESLSLCLFNNISMEGMIYMSGCYNLHNLYIVADGSNITELKTSIADMICPMKQLVSLSFTVYNRVRIILNNKNDIKMFISRYVKNE